MVTLRLAPHAEPARPRRGLWLWLERLLLIVGVVSLGYAGYVSVERWVYQEIEHRELNAILASGPPPGAVPSRESIVLPAPPPPANGAVIGRIEIPRLGVSVVVRHGADARTLRLAVGHIPGTALPWEIGNVGLAGHRDTFFRQLRDIQPDDEIRIVTPEGTFEFRVDRTRIVEPTDTWVLNPTGDPALTLVTCYPFNFIGAAPQRFIVHAVAARS